MTGRSVHAGLFTPGPRLGWTFRDRHQFRREFLDRPPLPPPQPHKLQMRLAFVERTYRGRRWILLTIASVIGGVAVLGAFSASGVGGFFLALVYGVLLAAPFLAANHFFKRRFLRASREVERYHDESGAEYRRFKERWEEHKRAFESAERRRIDELDEWGPVAVPSSRRRLDIFGGTIWGWEALLTVMGASMLSERPMLVLDLSRAGVCRELLRLADEAGQSVHLDDLSEGLATAALGAELTAAQIVGALVESMHGDEQQAAMSQRALDERILGKLLSALGDDVSLARLAAALRVLMGEHDDSPYLSATERTRIADDLFSDAYLRQAIGNLQRIESQIHPIELLGAEAGPQQSARLTCVDLGAEPISARTDLLAHLTIQWLTQRVRNRHDATPAVVVVGADELKGRHLERLSDVCERREVPLVLMFRRLREEQGRQLGGGVAAFLRLGNAEEAARAADYIGREHTYVLSQLTRTLGGSETHTATRTEGRADTEGESTSTSRSRTATWGRARGGSRTSSSTHNRSWTTTRNWSTAHSEALGSSWSEAETEQRVHEYAVEPIELQNLPDYALLLVRASGTRRAVEPVEFNPEIVTLDRVSLSPLPELELPAKPPWLTDQAKPGHPGIAAQHQTIYLPPASTGAAPIHTPDPRQGPQAPQQHRPPLSPQSPEPPPQQHRPPPPP